MKINQLKIKKKVKRVGRGPASNKGKTSGRGMNGQRSRAGASTKFISGGQTKLYMRLPKISKLKARENAKKQTVSFDFVLKNFNKTDEVTVDKIKKALGNDILKEVKIIAGKEKIEPRKYGKGISFSKSIVSI